MSIVYNTVYTVLIGALALRPPSGVLKDVRETWWPGMKARVTKFIGKCPTCLFNKEMNHRGAQLIPENGTQPWQCLQMDLVHLVEKLRYLLST